MKIVISSGHGKHIRGASGIIDEVDEARRVVEQVAEDLKSIGHGVIVFHDDVSTTQNENLERIVDAHNSETRDFDVSVHFNAYEATQGARGTEVLYVTQDDVAARVSEAISQSGNLINRGAKYRSDLYFLNQTEEPAILIETCFVDAAEDVENYEANFTKICRAIANVAGDDSPPDTGERPPGWRPPERPDVPPEQPPVEDALFTAQGRTSWFGGPDDNGVSSDEGLAFFYEYEDAPHLFLLDQPPGTSGLARRLNPAVYFVACRWDYSITPKDMLAQKHLMALVRTSNGREHLAWPADWGPHEDTGRVADISSGLLEALCITTDDEVEVFYPVEIE